ncbi:MAG: hypothetical protein ACLSX0_01860 [Anaerostipes caccae]
MNRIDILKGVDSACEGNGFFHPEEIPFELQRDDLKEAVSSIRNYNPAFARVCGADMTRDPFTAKLGTEDVKIWNAGQAKVNDVFVSPFKIFEMGGGLGREDVRERYLTDMDGQVLDKLTNGDGRFEVGDRIETSSSEKDAKYLESRADRAGIPVEVLREEVFAQGKVNFASALDRQVDKESDYLERKIGDIDAAIDTYQNYFDKLEILSSKDEKALLGAEKDPAAKDLAKEAYGIENLKASISYSLFQLKGEKEDILACKEKIDTYRKEAKEETFTVDEKFRTYVDKEKLSAGKQSFLHTLADRYEGKISDFLDRKEADLKKEMEIYNEDYKEKLSLGEDGRIYNEYGISNTGDYDADMANPDRFLNGMIIDERDEAGVDELKANCSDVGFQEFDQYKDAYDKEKASEQMENLFGKEFLKEYADASLEVSLHDITKDYGADKVSSIYSEAEKEATETGKDVMEVFTEKIADFQEEKKIEVENEKKYKETLISEAKTAVEEFRAVKDYFGRLGHKNTFVAAAELKAVRACKAAGVEIDGHKVTSIDVFASVIRLCDTSLLESLVVKAVVDYLKEKDVEKPGPEEKTAKEEKAADQEPPSPFEKSIEDLLTEPADLSEKEVEREPNDVSAPEEKEEVMTDVDQKESEETPDEAIDREDADESKDDEEPLDRQEPSDLEESHQEVESMENETDKEKEDQTEFSDKDEISKESDDFQEPDQIDHDQEHSFMVVPENDKEEPDLSLDEKERDDVKEQESFHEIEKSEEKEPDSFEAKEKEDSKEPEKDLGVDSKDEDDPVQKEDTINEKEENIDREEQESQTESMEQSSDLELETDQSVEPEIDSSDQTIEQEKIEDEKDEDSNTKDVAAAKGDEEALDDVIAAGAAEQEQDDVAGDYKEALEEYLDNPGKDMYDLVDDLVDDQGELQEDKLIDALSEIAQERGELEDGHADGVAGLIIDLASGSEDYGFSNFIDGIMEKVVDLMEDAPEEDVKDFIENYYGAIEESIQLKDEFGDLDRLSINSDEDEPDISYVFADIQVQIDADTLEMSYIPLNEDAVIRLEEITDLLETADSIEAAVNEGYERLFGEEIADRLDWLAEYIYTGLNDVTGTEDYDKEKGIELVNQHLGEVLGDIFHDYSEFSDTTMDVAKGNSDYESYQDAFLQRYADQPDNAGLEQTGDQLIEQYRPVLAMEDFADDGVDLDEDEYQKYLEMTSNDFEADPYDEPDIIE